jgi:Fe-S oxidoreductase
MIEGEFPAQLQSAFRGMERAKNPWGINHEKRVDWAAGLGVKTIDENPEPDVLYWVGCAASYDPQAQKTARAFVQLLQHAEINFAVLGKKECCTGDSARRAGNELLYQQLAGQNVATLNEVRPKLIVATCPHCMNAVGKEYRQLGGDYKVMHHTEYLESLVAQGRLIADASAATVAYHDPCYLGRHNGVYDAPRNVLRVLSDKTVELDRNRENSFCCGAGGAQFWKEEEPGVERISDNRYREAERVLTGVENKVLAVGCPFCKSMLESTPGKGASGDAIAVKDVAELLLEGVRKKLGVGDVAATPTLRDEAAKDGAPGDELGRMEDPDPVESHVSKARHGAPGDDAGEISSAMPLASDQKDATAAMDDAPARKKWAPKKVADPESIPSVAPGSEDAATSEVAESVTPVKRKVWSPTLRDTAAKDGAPEASRTPTLPDSGMREEISAESHSNEARPDVGDASAAPKPEAPAADGPARVRKKWSPKGGKTGE